MEAEELDTRRIDFKLVCNYISEKLPVYVPRTVDQLSFTSTLFWIELGIGWFEGTELERLLTAMK